MILRKTWDTFLSNWAYILCKSMEDYWYNIWFKQYIFSTNYGYPLLCTYASHQLVNLILTYGGLTDNTLFVVIFFYIRKCSPLLYQDLLISISYYRGRHSQAWNFPSICFLREKQTCNSHIKWPPSRYNILKEGFLVHRLIIKLGFRR